MQPPARQLAAQLRVLLRPHPGWYAMIAAVILAWLGISAIETVSPGHAQVQSARWLPVAIVAMALMLVPSPRWIGHMAYPVMIAATLLLIFVILPGVPRSIVPVRNGSTAWINLGFMSFQPS
ncbi:MAG: FtsW/RodA/SpoVE family cell cycle protein, partial [Phycisphaeraceae bacterium]